MRARNSIIFFLLAAAITMPTVAQPPAPARPRPLPAIQWPGASIGVPEGDYNKSLRSKADMDLPDPYDRDETWLKMPRGRVLGATSAIDIDKDGKSIWIADRCGGTGVCTGKHVAPVMKFDQNGNFVRAFGADMIVYPHGLWVDQQGNVWVADTRSNVEFPLRRDGTPEREVAAPGTVANGNQILKFSPEGKLLMRLGTPGRYGTDESHFTQPSDVVTAPNGDIFVADGHELMTAPPRIMHFDKNGKFIKAWDICSQSIQISDCSHSLAMDSQGRLFVADRGNSLVLVYDQNGKKLADWPQFGRPSGLYIDRNDVLYAADSESSVVQGHAYIRGVHVGSAKTGVVTAFLPDVHGNPVPWFPLRGTTGPEGVVADAAGHIFISQVQPFGQIARYTRKPSP